MSENTCGVETPRWRDRFFPQRRAPIPAARPGVFWLRTDVRSRLSWQDRLRLLISGECIVRIFTETDTQVETAQSESSFSVLPPRWLRR